MKHAGKSQVKRKYIADPGSIYKLMSKIQPFTDEELMKLELPIRISYVSIKTGAGTAQDFHDIAAAINCAMVRSESVDPLVEATAIAARDALMRTWHRFERTGRMGFDGPAIGEVEAGIDLHEQFCRMSTPLQMIEAMREVVRRGYTKQVVQ
jgi:hypothetical protein